jgi:hypothetical protein
MEKEDWFWFGDKDIRAAQVRYTVGIDPIWRPTEEHVNYDSKLLKELTTYRYEHEKFLDFDFSTLYADIIVPRNIIPTKKKHKINVEYKLG